MEGWTGTTCLPQAAYEHQGYWRLRTLDRSFKLCRMAHFIGN